MLARLPHLSIVLGLTATIFAGCLTPTDPAPAETSLEELLATLSQPIYDTVEKVHIQVPGHDGKVQDTWVFKPKTDDATARFPVFINFSPYWNNLAPAAETGGDAFSTYLIEEFVPRGYAIVLASVRGTGHSEGCFPIGGVKELEDAYAVIDHYADIEWSNGNIASGGKSYDGTTIQGVAGYKPHEALKLVFPVSGISDLYRYNYRMGVPYAHGPIFNTYYYAGVGVNQYADPLDQPLQAVIDDAACTDLPETQGHGISTGATGMYNSYWDERDYNNYAADVDTAFFFVHGLQDWNVKPDHILPWLENLPEGTVTKAYLHQWQQEGTGHVYPMRDDFNLTMHRMLDHYLLGIDTGVVDEPTFHVQDSEGRWRTEETWPPVDATTEYLVLGPDGTITRQYEAPSADSPAPTIMTPDPTAVTWTWELELDAELAYAGEPVFHGSLGTADPEAVYVVKLQVVNETGVLWMNEGVLKARLRDSLHMPSPMVPNAVYDYTIPFYPQDDVFPADSTLRVTLAQGGSAKALTVDPTVPTAVDLNNLPYLALPVHTPDAMESPQPEEIHCFAC